MKLPSVAVASARRGAPMQAVAHGLGARLATLWILLHLGCAPVPARDVGAALFSDPQLSGSAINVHACSTCHAMTDGSPRLYPGFDLRGAVDRPSFWGGASPSLLDATNACLVFFMRGQPLERDDRRGRALYEYLASANEGVMEPLPMTIVENVATVPRGDANRGRDVWDAACRECHGDVATGAGRLSPFASKVPDDSASFAAESGFPIELVIVEKVRHGGFFGVGGTMPPFALEALSDEDLGALLAYVLPET